MGTLVTLALVITIWLASRQATRWSSVKKILMGLAFLVPVGLLMFFAAFSVSYILYVRTGQVIDVTILTVLLNVMVLGTCYFLFAAIYRRLGGRTIESSPQLEEQPTGASGDSDADHPRGSAFSGNALSLALSVRRRPLTVGVITLMFIAAMLIDFVAVPKWQDAQRYTGAEENEILTAEAGTAAWGQENVGETNPNGIQGSYTHSEQGFHFDFCPHAEDFTMDIPADWSVLASSCSQTVIAHDEDTAAVQLTFINMPAFEDDPAEALQSIYSQNTAFIGVEQRMQTELGTMVITIESVESGTWKGRHAMFKTYSVQQDICSQNMRLVSSLSPSWAAGGSKKVVLEFETIVCVADSERLAPYLDVMERSLEFKN